MDDLLRGWSDLIFLVNQAFFVATFVVVAARALHERRRSAVDVALLFGVMALLLVVSQLGRTLGIPPESSRVMVTPLILAAPYLLLRLVADFAAVPWWAMRLAETVFAVQVVAFIFQGSLPFALVAVYAAVPFAWSSFAFVREARRTRGVACRRYRAIATGNAAAVGALVVVALGVLAGGETVAPAAAIATQLCVLAVGVSYFIGFATPQWLRRLWRDSELRSFLAAAPRVLTVPDKDELIRELASGVRATMGFDGATIGLPAGPGRLRFVGTGTGDEAIHEETPTLDVPARVQLYRSDVPERAQLYRDKNANVFVAAPIKIGGEIIGMLKTSSSHASLFASDDLEMCELLADQLAFALQSRALIDEREYQADHDALTRLPNSRVLYRAIEARIAAATPFALLLLDLDAFAEVNQTFGHVIGDQLLTRVGERLRASVPEASVLARWSGDQFAVLLPEARVVDAESAAAGLVSSFEQSFDVAEEEVECGVSIGIALFPDHGTDARSMVAAADVALGMAKRAANTYAVYMVETPHHARRLALRADLRRAIGDGSVRVEYQPLVSLRSGTVLRFEALARWDHPQRGAIPPSEFVDLAERTGLIRPLTDRILDQALSDAREWRLRLPRLRVAVNLSGRMFADATLIDRIAAACRKTDCDPQGLSLEITESVLVTEPERARHTIARLRELGVTTEIDDFGTGYSSLAYLQRLPVSALKIDRQFSAAMSTDERSDAIVRATIRLSHELGFEVVGEGIETRELWDLLAASGCDIGQGYYIAGPMRAEAIRGWLRSWTVRPQAAARAPLDHRRLVLVVDDDPAIVSVIRDVLTEHGYAVVTASEGQEALQRVAERKPDAVLLDVHMPVLDGAAFVETLRDRGIDVPVVVMTAGPSAQKWADRLGASGALAKPFAMDQLLAATGRVAGGGAPLLA